MVNSPRLHTKRPRQDLAGTKNIGATFYNVAETTSQLHHVVSTLPLSNTKRFLKRHAMLCVMCMSFVDIET